MRALITGIAGFVGSHLADYLLNEVEGSVGGICRPGSDRRHIAHLTSRLTLFSGDVTDAGFLDQVLASWQPQYIFHLAGQSAPSLAWTMPRETLTVNILGQYNLLEAATRLTPRAVVLVVGSAEEYGLVDPAELPVKETNPLRPNSPYGVSKIAQDMLGYQFFLSHGLRTIRVRPFNHIGPRQSEAFVTASLARQIAEIEGRRRPARLLVGNLQARRDFCDVRDVVRGYWLAMLHGTAGEVYNVGSGKSWSIAELLAMLLGHAAVDIAVEQDPARLRPSDVLDLICDATKLRDRVGWSPRIPIAASLCDVLEYWRRRVEEE